MTDDLDQQATEVVEAALDAVVAQLVAQGVPLAAILAVMHATAVSSIAGLFGGDFAAARSRAAAARVEGLPPASSPDLVMVRPIGRA